MLAFEDFSPDGGQAYFADGLSEELLNVLAQVPELKVAGRTSSFAFKGTNTDLRAELIALVDQQRAAMGKAPYRPLHPSDERPAFVN